MDVKLSFRWRKLIEIWGCLRTKWRENIWTHARGSKGWWRKLFVMGSFFPECGVGLVPKRGCLLTLAYYAFPRWYEFGERRWNDILTGEKRRTRRNTCPSATLSTKNPTWIDPGANPGLRGERPATNDLSHGTAPYIMGSFTFSSVNITSGLKVNEMIWAG
jgi:hypothetical protein